MNEAIVLAGIFSIMIYYEYISKIIWIKKSKV